jgi:hypothetical protein
VLGTWFLGLMAVLVVIDGTKSLAANAPLWTSVVDVWVMFAPEHWANTEAWIAQSLDASGLGNVLRMVLSWPAAAISGVLGLLFLMLGRKRRKRSYLETI